MASVRGLLNIQSLNESTHENSHRIEHRTAIVHARVLIVSIQTSPALPTSKKGARES